MKLFTSSVMSVGLALAATGANAQILVPNVVGGSNYTIVSDVGGPYAAMPQEAPVPAPGYGPTLLPPQEVYTVLRDSGFSPLGAPQQRGLVYTIAVIDRGGEDGRLVIDARTGRILRFMPADRMGEHFDDAPTATYAPPSPPPPTAVRGEPRPPRSIPKVASRTSVPLPKAAPHAAEATKPLAAQPAAPAQQSVAAQAKPADPQTTGQAAVPAVAPVEAKPAPQILPTQNMPKALGLE